MAFISSRPRNRVQKAFNPSADDLGRRVVNGAAFTFLGIALRTSITVGSMAVLARLLTPADFGHIAMATVITELAAVFANFGFGSILIQRLRISRIQIDTMHWCAVGLGMGLTSLVFGLSFLSVHLFQDEMVAPLLRVLCLSFILEELTMAPRSLLARRMQFKLDFFIQSSALIARAGTAIIMALNGMGVWSLAGGALAGSTVQTCAYQALTGYWPRFRFSPSFLKSTWRTNGSHFGNGILFYINANLDFMLVGRMLGATLLGQYQNARSLTDEVRVRMVQPLQRVLFPAFSAIQNDPDRFRDGIFRSGRLLALTFFPMGFGVAAVAPELVKVLYGSQWLPMIPILQVISIATGLGAAASIGTPIFNATNRIAQSFKLYGVSTLLTIAFMLFGSQWGLMGVAWSRLALAVVGLVIFRISLGLVNLRTKHIWQLMGTPCIASGLMWWLLDSSRDLVQTWTTGIALQLGCLIGIGAAFYVLISLLISPQHVRDVIEVASKLRRNALRDDRQRPPTTAPPPSVNTAPVPGMRVSVLVPTYNRANYISECLDSLLAQTMAALEIIVIDDGSEDQTKEVLSRYGQRIRYVHKNNAGKPSAVNLGLSLAQGELIWIFDDDDVALPNAIASRVASLQARPDAGFVYSPHLYGSDQADGKIRQDRIHHIHEYASESFLFELMKGCFFHLGTALVRADAYHTVGGFDTELLSSEDYDIQLRLARAYPAAFCPEPSFIFRQHAGPRGAKVIRYNGSQRVNVFKKFDQRIGQKLNANLPLGDYLVPRQDHIAASSEHRQALLARMTIMASKGCLSEMMEDLYRVLALLPSDRTPPPAERNVIVRAICTGYAADAIKDHWQDFKALLAGLPASPAGRSVLRSIATGLYRRAKGYPDPVLERWLRLRQAGLVAIYSLPVKGLTP